MEQGLELRLTAGTVQTSETAKFILPSPLSTIQEQAKLGFSPRMGRAGFLGLSHPMSSSPAQPSLDLISWPEAVIATAAFLLAVALLFFAVALQLAVCSVVLSSKPSVACGKESVVTKIETTLAARFSIKMSL